MDHNDREEPVMPPLQGVIFDMDGLMFDTEPIWGACWEEVLAEAGMEMPEGLPDGLRGRTGDAMYEALHHHLGADAPVERLWERERELACERIAASPVPVKPGLLDLLIYLHDCQLPMAVASSSPKPLIEANLARAGIAGNFGVVVSGDAVAASKPDPAIFLEAATLLGTAPSRTLVLEDSPTGVEAGYRGGFPTVMVPDLIAPTDEDRSRSVAVLDTLDAVIDLIEARFS